MESPSHFQREFLGRRLGDKQVEICDAVMGNRSISIKGCHGSGKTFVVSGMVPYDCTCYDEARPELQEELTIAEGLARNRVRSG